MTAARPDPTHVLDRWILGQLDATTAAVTEALEGFDALTGATRIAALVDDLSNWYVRRSRPRFWGADDPDAHATLHHCLVVTSRLLAPFCPFLAEEIHGILTDDRLRPPGRLARGPPAPDAAALRSTGHGHGAPPGRAWAGRPAPTPRCGCASRSPAPSSCSGRARLSDELRAEVAAELNVKEVDEVDTLSGLMTWEVIPNFRALGPRLGPRLPALKAALAEADGTALRAQLLADGAIEVAGERLGPDEVELRAQRHESFALAEDGGWAVALDLTVDDDLRAEGVARELIRAVNDLRKEADLALSDRIHLAVDGDQAVTDAAAAHRDRIASETLATRGGHRPVGGVGRHRAARARHRRRHRPTWPSQRS